MENNKVNILEMEDVHSGYGEIEVLKGISLFARKGQIVSIIGANGAGKSTLMKTIFGMVPTTSGRITYEGDEITHASTYTKLERGIAYVPEGRSNFPGMTVQENLEMGAYTRKDDKQIREEINVLCERFPILKMKRYTDVGNLSGGQQQMVEIAMGLMLKPRLMLIDEPTLGLAPILVTEVLETIKEINQSGTTILIVEQNAKRALEISDYAYVMELGRIRMQGAAEELSKDQEVIEAYLGER